VPFFASLGLVGYISYKEINDCLNRHQNAWVNKDYCKSKNKIADIIQKSEINAAIEKNDKVAYCRCWKSKTVNFFLLHKCFNSLTTKNIEFNSSHTVTARTPSTTRSRATMSVHWCSKTRKTQRVIKSLKNTNHRDVCFFSTQLYSS
jgi:hypothetical protein